MPAVQEMQEAQVQSPDQEDALAVRRRNGNPLQYSCQENPMDRGAWGPTVHGVAKSQTRLKRLSIHAQAYMGQFLCSVIVSSCLLLDLKNNDICKIFCN